ncbi:type II secretion system F family protein [Chloroflexota bacterium]
MIYQYVAYNESGELVKGKLSAASDEAATELLGYAGYQTISLKPYVPLFNLEKLLASLSRVKPTEITLLYRQLAMLLESGTDIAASLELLQAQATNRTLKKILAEVTSDVRNGNQLSTVLEKHPKVFSPMYCRLLSVGEQSGGLEAVLTQVADYMEKEAVTSKETKNALMMPVITSIIAVVVIGLLVTFILPSFSSLYGSLGVDLPPMAKILITIGEMAHSHGIYLLLAVLAIVGPIFLYIKTPGGRYKWDKLLLRLPLMGRVRHLSELARYCRSMSLLFRAGMPLSEVMSLAIQSSGNRAMAKALMDVQQDMIKGEGLSGPMAKNKLFLPMMVQMVKVGEETGSLDITLQVVARSYEAEAEDKMRTIIGLIQPAMTLLIGGVVGVIALSLTSAMTAMYGEAF